MTEACANNPCPSNRRRLPCEWIDILNNNATNPKGKWANFNCNYKVWRSLRNNANNERGILCADDLPHNPIVSDYTDLTSEATEGCAGMGWETITDDYET